MEDDKGRPSGTWVVGDRIDPDEYIVGAWYVGLNGVAVFAKLVRRTNGHELRITTATEGRTTTITVSTRGSEAEAVASASRTLGETVEDLSGRYRLLIPLEYVPIGGDYLAYIDKVTGKPWSVLTAKARA